jgi:chromate reductase
VGRELETWIKQMMLQPVEPVRLLSLTGSLRRHSFSTAILKTLQAEFGPAVRLEIRGLQLPLYNQDQEGDATPEEVFVFREAIQAADGLVISTPEYNHGIPGVLKNALDWASRPSNRSVLRGKPTLVISNSPAFTGGVRAHTQAHETLLSVDARIVGGRQVVIGGVKDKVANGLLVDRAAIDFSLAAVDRLVALCHNVRSSGCG